MRSLLGTALIFSLALAAEAGSRKSVFRVHLEANEHDGSVFAQPIRSLSSRPVYVQKTPWLSERDVTAYYPYRATDGSYGALLRLDDHGRTVLDTLSIEHRGSHMFIFLNGRAIAELQIDRRVSDGRIYLASGLTDTDIKLMAKDWKLIGGKKRK